MPSVIISDTSCLIILHKIGKLELLRDLYKIVIITPEILLEFGENIPDWIETQQVKDTVSQRLLELQIDKGEASAIALAMQFGDAVIIVDDWKARRVAQQLEIPITGTLGVIIKAKQK